jgi:DNA-binding transcriptional LysR family regulator
VRDRRVVPTAEGRLVIEVAEEVLEKVHALEEHFRLAYGHQALCVGAVSLLAATTLSDAVAAFQSREPEARVQVISLDPDELYDALVEGRVDCAVAYREYVPTDIDIEPLPSSRVICAAAPDHPLADGRAHCPVELLKYPLALTQKGMLLRGKVEAWFQEAAATTELPVAFEARTAALLAQVAASSHGFITFLTEGALRQFNLVQILIDGPPLHSSPVICYLPGYQRRPVVDRFLDALRSTAGQGRPEVGAAP